MDRQAEAFRENLEDWFNNAMERVGGWYKRWTQRVLFCLAALVVVVSNADTVMLIQRLSKDNALRASLVAAAQNAVKVQPVLKSTEPASGETAAASSPSQSGSGGEASTSPDLQMVLKTAENLKLPVGWSFDSKNPDDPRYFRSPELSWGFAGWAFYKTFGLLISVLAVSMGASFWFDTLSKFINLRGTGTRPGETSKSAGRNAGRNSR